MFKTIRIPNFAKITHPHRDVNTRAMDVNPRKPFGLRSDYVQITVKGIQITFDLRKYYVKIAQKINFFWHFWPPLKFFRNLLKPCLFHWDLIMLLGCYAGDF